MVDIAVNVPADNDVVANYPAAERSSRAAILDAVNGAAFWGGTSGGSADAQTVAVALTGWAYDAGAPLNFIPGFTNATTTPTLNVNGLGAKTIVTLEDLTIPVGSIVAGRLCQVLYDGTKFRLLNRVNFVSQVVYDALFPVGRFVEGNVETAPAVPPGITATWTRQTGTQYLRIQGTGAPTTGGTLTTGSGGGGTTGNNSASHGVDAAGSTLVAEHTHTHSIPAHTHTIEPTFRSVVLWLRTA